MIMASHQIFYGQNKHLSGKIKFGQTNLLDVINGNFIKFAKNNECSDNFWSLSCTGATATICQTYQDVLSWHNKCN